jgi:hypothetical protein
VIARDGKWHANPEQLCFKRNSIRKGASGFALWHPDSHPYQKAAQWGGALAVRTACENRGGEGIQTRGKCGRVEELPFRAAYGNPYKKGL